MSSCLPLFGVSALGDVQINLQDRFGRSLLITKEHLTAFHHDRPAISSGLTVLPASSDKRVAIICISACSRIAVMERRVGSRYSRRIHSWKDGCMVIFPV